MTFRSNMIVIAILVLLAGLFAGSIESNLMEVFSDPEWMQRKMIEKACEWMKLRLVARIGSEDAHEFLTEFRKAMEE